MNIYKLDLNFPRLVKRQGTETRIEIDRSPCYALKIPGESEGLSYISGIELSCITFHVKFLVYSDPRKRTKSISFLNPCSI